MEDNIQTAADLGREAAIARMDIKAGDYMDAKPFIVLRNADGSDSIRFLDEKKDRPHRMKGRIVVNDEASFCEYVKRYSGEGQTATTVYGQREPD